jgi:cyclic nucleotide-binding protein
LAAYATAARYGADEILLHSGEVPTAMAFLVAGRVRLTATAEDGSLISVGTLEEGAFLGQTALTRQPVLAGAYALDEVTVLQIDREHMEELVLRKPLLLQEIAAPSKTGGPTSGGHWLRPTPEPAPPVGGSRPRRELGRDQLFGNRCCDVTSS